MNKFLDALSDKLLPLANFLGSNKYLTVLRVYVMPLCYHSRLPCLVL